MRLMQVGKSVYIVGSPTCPAMNREDLLVVGSGSGETVQVNLLVEQALKNGAKVIGLTGSSGSTLSQNSNLTVTFPARSTKILQKGESKLPLGGVYEIALLIYLDCLIMDIARIMNQDADDFASRHTNLE